MGKVRGKTLVLFWLAILGVVVVWFSPSKVFATSGINQQLSFEGKVDTSAGVNIPNGTYNMEFKIYSGGTATGGGTLEWTEDYLVGGSGGGVTFNGGTFQVNLGSVCAFSGGSCETYTNTPINWSSYPLYLSMQIGNTSSCTVTTSFTANCGGNGEMTPYILLTATPYSFNSSELGGLSSSAFSQLSANQTFSGTNNFASSTNSTTAFSIQNSSASTLFDANTINGYIGIGTATPSSELNVVTSSYTSGQVVISDGETAAPPAYPNSYTPALVVQTSETNGSRPLYFGYNNGTGGWGAFLTSGACGSFSQMCLDLGNATTADTALVNEGTTLDVGGGPDGNFTNVAIPDNTSISGSLSLGTASSSNGSLTFNSSGGSNTISLNSSEPSASYSLTLPTTAPGVNQCLETGTTTAADLLFGSCMSIGTLDGGTANSNGASVSGTTLYLQSASASEPGLINTTTQTLAGNKTFNGTLSVSGAVSLSSTVTFAGGATISSYSGGTWFNLPTTGPSAIGSGGAGVDAWLGYSYAAGNWFSSSIAGDLNFMNTNGSLNFGNSSSDIALSIDNSNVGVGLRGANSLLQVNGPIATAIKTVTANYTVTASDSTILGNGSLTVTLPSATGIAGRVYVIKNIGASTVTVATNGGSIDGSSTFSLSSTDEAITVQSDGTNWWIIESITGHVIV